MTDFNCNFMVQVAFDIDIGLVFNKSFPVDPYNSNFKAYANTCIYSFFCDLNLKRCTLIFAFKYLINILK